ncbi:hypothetical protein L3Q82_026086, partial [Scortum barcoo]
PTSDGLSPPLLGPAGLQAGSSGTACEECETGTMVVVKLLTMLARDEECDIFGIFGNFRISPTDFSCDETEKGPPVQMHSLKEFEQSNGFWELCQVHYGSDITLETCLLSLSSRTAKMNPSGEPEIRGWIGLHYFPETKAAYMGSTLMR